jgi:hypothetical protein
MPELKLTNIILSAIEQIKSESDVEDFNWSYADGLDRAIVILREQLQDNKNPIKLKNMGTDNNHIQIAANEYVKSHGYGSGSDGIWAILNDNIERAFISGANWQKNKS